MQERVISLTVQSGTVAMMDTQLNAGFINDSAVLAVNVTNATHFKRIL